MLSYPVEGRLEPFWAYLAQLGISSEDITQAVIARPSLLGLRADKNLEKVCS